MHLQIDNLDKSFKQNSKVLSSINLSVQKGEIVSILGPSGCGKSTILRILAGLETFDKGSVNLNGSMSFVFQQSLLLEWRTALENVLLPLELGNESKSTAQQKAKQCLNLVNLKQDSEKYPDELSGGMQMRVSLARALVTEPEILLLDEPFAALDEMTRELLNEELLCLNRQKKMTMLLVTHNIFEAVFMSDRIIILGQSPATIIADIPVSLPRPRQMQVRGLPEFAAIVGEVQKFMRYKS
ncbi:MAG: ABC transporter ATP-binding protein [Lentisphaeraceae bacterium]|nr:ABC transporter ATP-binding protein [Lentisphaeraceae bacterium]